MELDGVRCLEVIREWYDGLSGLNAPLSENEMLFHKPWVLQQMGRPDWTAILLDLMVENNMVHPSTSDEELLEPGEALERQQQQQQPECCDDEMFEFSDEFLDLVKRMEE